MSRICLGKLYEDRVFKKFDGSNAVVRKLGLPGKLEPTLVGFGTISSSGLSDIPAPNLIIVLSFSSMTVVNLLDTFLSLRIYEADSLSPTEDGSLAELFSILKKSS